ncbi:hypothetical protein [uncultured Cytophaga sp.]|uniref:hypothetical protein n=1 Tax=uncultured Cytophaga sp. TaxID=160238 RepID=UPI0026254830|nr:hypothetical protein [uncultured Cytophaga sp.]
MKNEIAGKGNRKPQLDIPVGLINLDPLNPRIVPYTEGNKDLTEFDLTSILYKHFDTQVIALSLVANGYFDEEPVILVPNKLPEGFEFSKYPNVDDLTNQLKQYVEKGEIKFTVVEGNRRVSTIKILTNSGLREKIFSDKNYPEIPSKEILEDISIIPCIIYENRESVSSYLGVRHIAGLLKWEAFAKAYYIADTIEKEKQKGRSELEALQHVQQIVGDRSDTIRKQYITYKLFLEARDDLDFDTKPLIEDFSLMTVLYNSPAIREYMKVESYAKVNLDERIVPIKSLPEFTNILTWIFGNSKTGEKAILTDSRNITNQLSYVVNNETARNYLIEFKDLDGAFERTNGEKEFLSKNLIKATRAIQTSLQFAYKYKKDEELLKQLKSLEELIAVLKENLQ